MQTGFSETLIGWKSGKTPYVPPWDSLDGGSVAMDSVMKTKKYRGNTRFKIISGLRNSLQNHRRVPVCRNKQFEEGYWKDFHN